MNVEYPQSVLEIAAECAAKHPSDISKAVAETEARIRKLKEFPKLVDMLVRSAVQELVYDMRHQSNRRIKNDAGKYGATPKVVSGRSLRVNQIAEDVYQMKIAGRALGDILGGQLLAIAETEEEIANGHSYNARLCRRLDQIVPEGKRVKDAVPLKRLRSIFKEVGMPIGRSAA